MRIVCVAEGAVYTVTPCLSSLRTAPACPILCLRMVVHKRAEDVSVIFVFVDGVGLAPWGHDNPLSDAPTPALHALLGGALTSERTGVSTATLLRPLDATLGVAGLPQSGTGQTALLAGINAAALHGRHQPHVPPVALRPTLAGHNIFGRVIAAGGRATFANAFGARYWEALAARRVRRSASVIAAEGARVRFRDENDLRAGLAVTWDITGDAMRARDGSVTTVAAREAGARLARLGVDHDLVFFETFLTDLAGHGRLNGSTENETVPMPIVAQIHTAMTRIDGLIAGALDAMRPHDTLVVTSDHGNVESLAAPTHTRNPVPLLVVGPGVPRFTRLTSIEQVADAIVALAQEQQP